MVPVADRSLLPVFALKEFKVTVDGLKVMSALEICIGLFMASDEKTMSVMLAFPEALIRSYAFVSIAFMSKAVFNFALKIPESAVSNSIG